MSIPPTDLVAIDPAGLPEKKTVEDITRTISLEDPSLPVTYGVRTMREISKFSDGLLERVRARDAGEMGELLTDLMLNVKGIDLSAFGKEKKGFFRSLPVIGDLLGSAEREVAKFDTLAKQVDVISRKLDSSIVQLIRDIEVLEQLYNNNLTFHKDLTAHIEAGRQKLEEARATELPRLQAEAEESGDAMKAQAVRDYADRLNRFERRLHDLQLSRTITLQTAPQIRVIQGNNQTLVEKIQTSLLTTIPVWKNQMVLALSLDNQRKAASLQKQVADTTNELLRRNAEMLQQSSVATANEVERSVIDIETLREVQQKLVSTIEETLRIAQDGRQKRLSVEKELVTMEDELRERLTSLQATADQAAVEHNRPAGALEDASAPTTTSGSAS
ncbi:toxic anion resistance protein [Phaeovibrio sulfidiphilus]|uniref:Toxic anion resistance protein n=1 Tax=Phaeovibrio sulfidiphilus TaxID=1220600 RepID=A0A8J7CP65_9PROT|nr:toxic anion resistance protein [Phaeovibrio sulfidiphilus]MBE1236692.1 toxic anion resistance protein [Phaeovibrio sulfidiphilus]